MQLNNFKPRLSKAVFCFVLSLTIIGCAGYTYKYKGQNFHSQEEALNALKIDLYDVKTQITPTMKTNGGVAAVVIPTSDTFVALGISKIGHPEKELTDYIGKYLVVSNTAMYDFIDKRKIFNKVILVVDDYPTVAAKKIIAEYDVVIYLDLVSPEQAQWFMRAAPKYKNVPIKADESRTFGYHRIMSWLENIENNLNNSDYNQRR